MGLVAQTLVYSFNLSMCKYLSESLERGGGVGRGDLCYNVVDGSRGAGHATGRDAHWSWGIRQ